MTHTPTLNAIAIDVVGQYAGAAKHLLEAYRVGAQRTITGIGGGYVRLIDGRKLPLVTDELKTALIESEQRIADAAVGVIGRASDWAQTVVDSVSGRTVEGIEAFGEKTAWADKMMVVGAVRQLNLPAAKLSLQVATRTQEAAAKLAERVATIGVAQPKAAAKRAPKAAARTAAKRVRRARKTA